jgi:hypothetical protein
VLAALAACVLVFPGEATATAADTRSDAAVEQPAAPAAAESPAAKEESSAPALPFTEVDALALAALTVSLLAAGFVLRRFSTPR